MQVVVTGAAGFIGSHLCERLLADGHDVLGIDAFIPYYAREVKESNLRASLDYDRFTFAELDLRDMDLVNHVADADAIVHMAAQAGPASWNRFDLYVTCNLSATQRLLEATRIAGDLDARRFIHISTSSIYGTEALGDETSRLRPASPYGITKLAAEQLTLAYHQSYGLPATVLRYFSIYGPRQRPDMAYHLFINALLRDEPITIFGDGEQTRGNTFIDDCVDGTVSAIYRGIPGEAYNIGGGTPISLNAAITILEEATGKRAIRRYVERRLGDQRHTLADIGKARAHLGFEPRVAPSEGLPRQVMWQRAAMEHAYASSSAR